MKKSDRPLMIAALRERLPAEWIVFESGQMVRVRGPEAPDDRYANQWLLGSGAPFSYPAGQNIISRFEPKPGYDTGFLRQYASFHGRRGYRDLMVNKVLELIANPPLTPTQRAARERAKEQGQRSSTSSRKPPSPPASLSSAFSTSCRSSAAKGWTVADPVVKMIHRLAADFPLNKAPTNGARSSGDPVRAAVLACASDILSRIEEEIRNEMDFQSEAAPWVDILDMIPLPSMVREDLERELQERSPRKEEPSDA